MQTQKTEDIPKVVPIEKLLQYNLSTEVYSVPCQIPVQNFCNGFTVRNVGTATVVIMGDALAPNESKAIGGNRGEIFVGRIDLKFINTGGGRTTLALVTQKYYMNVPRQNETI
jgi:hypothetical protein